MKKLWASILAITLISSIALSGCKDNNKNSSDVSESVSITDSQKTTDSKTVTDSKTTTDKTEISDNNKDSITDASSFENNSTAKGDDSVVEYNASNLVNISTIKDNIFTYNNSISFEVPENFEIDRLSKCVSCKTHDDCKSKITFFDSTQSMKVDDGMTYDNISEDFVNEMYNGSIKKAESHGMETEKDNGGVRSFEKYEINGYKAVKYTMELNLGKSNTVITSVLVYLGNQLYSIGFTDYDGLHLDDFNKCIETISVTK